MSPLIAAAMAGKGKMPPIGNGAPDKISKPVWCRKKNPIPNNGEI